ncbi:MAG: hypothetical protein Q8Q25_01520 [bacterium]|nr:hypothetical protein [bacterium]
MFYFKIIYFLIFLITFALRGQRQLFCVPKTVGSKGHQQPAGLLFARIPATRLTARTIRRATGINYKINSFALMSDPEPIGERSPGTAY